MKKTAALLLALLIAGSVFAGCSGQKKNATEPTVLPTNEEVWTTTATTAATQPSIAPTVAPTTRPATEPNVAPTTEPGANGTEPGMNGADATTDPIPDRDNGLLDNTPKNNG